MWGWSSADNPVAGAPSTSDVTQQQQSRAQFQAVASSSAPAQRADNFFYGQHSSIASHNSAAGNNSQTSYNPVYGLEDVQQESRFEAGKQQAKRTKKSSKAPILKRKDKLRPDTNEQEVSSVFGTSLPSEPPYASFDDPNSVQESILGRTSLLVVDDYRANGKHSIGSRSSRSQTSAVVKEYRPTHVPEPVVPGFILSSSEDEASGLDSPSLTKASLQRYEPTSAFNADRYASSNDNEVDVVLNSGQAPPPPPPPPPPVISQQPPQPQPLYAIVNKNLKPKRPDLEDPIYSTIEEANKADSARRSKQTPDVRRFSVLDELKQRLSLRVKPKDLHPQIYDPESGTNEHKSAFRPYNSLQDTAAAAMDNKSEADYDIAIPIDRVLLKDGSSPDEDMDRNYPDTQSNVSKSDDVIVPTEADIYYPEKGSLGGSVLAQSTHSAAVTDDQLSKRSLDSAQPPPPPTFLAPTPVPKAGSNLSSSLNSHVTEQSYDRSRDPSVIHEPILETDFKPKSILKNSANNDDSSDYESDDDDGEPEVAPKAQVEEYNDTYHLVIPVEPSPAERQSEAQTMDDVIREYDIPRSLQQQIKASSGSTLHNSLRAARVATPATSVADGYHDNHYDSIRKTGGVSFTSDTRDNEGMAKQYEKEGFACGVERSVVAAPAQTDIPFSEPTQPVEVHTYKPESFATKPAAYAEQPTEPSVAMGMMATTTTTTMDYEQEVRPKPATHDQCVSTDNDPLDATDSVFVQSRDHDKIPDTIQRQDYALVVKSPRGILKHPNGTATLQLNQPNQLVIAAPDKSSTLPNGSLRINTNLNPNGTFRGVSYSPDIQHSPQSPSYTLRKTGDNISVVSISGYDPAWDKMSNYSSDTIRTLDDYNTGTVRTMVSLGTYTNPYVGRDFNGNHTAHYRREISESSTDPLAFSMSIDNKLFEYRAQNQPNGLNNALPFNKKREVKSSKHTKKSTAKSKSQDAQKKTTFAAHKLGKDSVFKKDKTRKRKRRNIKILALVSVFVVVVVTVSLVIYFLTDEDNKQGNADE